MPSLRRTLLLLGLVAQAAAYVAPGAHSQAPLTKASLGMRTSEAMPEFVEKQATDSWSFFPAMLGCAVGFVVALAPMAASAMVEYDNVQYLGGSDKVDINNANVQAYRQFPGMYPTAAGFIATHGPFKDVADVYNIPNMPEAVKSIIKKYEANLVCLPANQAYFLDRINNGMYR